MKTLSLVIVMMIFGIGHSYAEDSKTQLVVPGEFDRAPHEKEVITEYEKLMNGEVPVSISNPTDEYSLITNNARIFDEDRNPGKIVGRAPAVIGDAAIKEYLENSKVKEK